MPSLTFGLNAVKQKAAEVQAGQKRKKNLFGEDEDEDTNEHASPTENVSLSTDRVTLNDRPRKSPKPAHVATKNVPPSQQYSNLSALRSTKKLDEEAKNLDSSIYDYDNAYDTFHAPKDSSNGDTKISGPKYMTSLLQSAETRKRDQLRAKERLLQKEREAEGDEFADKEKFVTGAYRAQQEEVKRMEEEEARREAEEEEKRRRGGGMTEFYKDLLKKDEERSLQISKAAEAATTNPPHTADPVDGDAEPEKSDAKIAAELNEKGAHIIVNDDGEVVDKRQLLSAGLNVAATPKPAHVSKGATNVARPTDLLRSSATHAARQSQRERQSRMMAAQLEDIAEKQAQQEAEEQRAVEEKAKSQKTSTEISSAKDRYLARKRETEEEAKRAKAAKN